MLSTGAQFVTEHNLREKIKDAREALERETDRADREAKEIKRLYGVTVDDSLLPGVDLTRAADDLDKRAGRLNTTENDPERDTKMRQKGYLQTRARALRFQVKLTSSEGAFRRWLDEHKGSVLPELNAGRASNLEETHA